MNWPLVRHVMGMLLLLETIFMTLCAFVSAGYWMAAGEADCLSLLLPAILCGATSAVLIATSKHYTTQISQREGFFIVAIAWVLFSVFGMLPYLLYGTCTTITDAFLETMSGFTTTGCTILTAIDEQPHGILLWRSMTQWIGGLGIVVFTLALLPKIASGNIQMFSAEVTGMSVDKLRPKIQATSRRLWIIYVTLTLSCAVLYFLGGMSVFDAICHALTTLSSGGFSTHQASIGVFHSAFIEYVCCLFLFITSLNFSLFYMVQRGHFMHLWRDEEARTFALIVVGFTLFFCLLFGHAHAEVLPISTEQAEALPNGIESTFRASLFHVLSIISTCGFQGECYDYQLWGVPFWLPTVMMMAMGGCAGSTAGGLKTLRSVLLLKTLRMELYHQVHPNEVVRVRLNGHAVPSEHLYRTLAFFFMFIVTAVVCVFCLQMEGMDCNSAIGTTITALGNTGPGLGMTGPAYTWAELAPFSKWIMSAAMLIGRLEFFTVILLFTRSFWRNR